MGAVQFFSPTSGVGLTAAQLICFKRGRTGSQVSLRPQPVRVAVTGDGGRSWQVTGTAAPAGPPRASPSGEELVAGSPQRLWAVVGSGRLVDTGDAGRNWRQATFPGPVLQLLRSGDELWSLSCPHVASPNAPLACRPQLWHAPIDSGIWTQVTVPGLTAQAPEYVDMAVTEDRRVLLSLMTAGRTATGELAISTDAGVTWRTRLEPRWDGHACTFGGALAGAPPTTFWLLCVGTGAAGSSPKGLLQTTDSGSTWTTVSAVPSLTRKPPPGSISVSEPSALAAGSVDRLWLAVTNGLTQSDDGGRSWSVVPTAVDPGGWPTTIAVLDAQHAWLLAPGAGLWSTTDGRHWEPVGALHTN